MTEGRRLPDRRGRRAVECCLKQNGAYYRDLAGTSVKWRAAGPEIAFPGRELRNTSENRSIPARCSASSVLFWVFAGLSWDRWRKSNFNRNRLRLIKGGNPNWIIPSQALPGASGS